MATTKITSEFGLCRWVETVFGFQNPVKTTYLRVCVCTGAYDQVEVSGLRAQVQIRRAFLLFELAYVALSCVRRSVMPLNFGK